LKGYGDREVTPTFVLIERTIMITRIHHYYLGQTIDDAKDLREFTDEEYRTFEVAGALRMLNDEKIYYGTKVEFANFN
jgi:hypothetical protein